ncbi:ATP-dependent nuclease [Georgenia sp. Z1344]|uniref:ATP-dependent nuclease n=1 Tax=Georgenia sp. Z1344 TaxID=3416706 RepID=UPI003CF8CD7B
MRIRSFEIENYRGIRHAHASDLDTRPLTLITGKNGTGKSLILEALTAAWSGNINLPDFVGPYGNQLRIAIELTLDEHEYELVNSWRTARELPEVSAAISHTLEAVSTNRESTGTYSPRDEMVTTLQNPQFSKSHPFASIDLLSARRQLSTTSVNTVDMSMLDRAAAAAARRDMYDQEIRWKAGMHMPDIGTYLTSLDYRNYVAGRSGIEVEDEYSRLSEIFHAATSKEILRPAYDPDTTKTAINVRLPSGITHELEDLSNGEREMLGMLYYVAQLSAHGGVLLLDEPEKHLHPSLQSSVLTAMLSVASRGQALTVTHSPNLISAAPSDAVIIVHPAWGSATNQVQSTNSDDTSAGALADLGIPRRDLFQSSFLLVVEGQDDQQRLKMLLPDVLADAKVLIAGGRREALNVATSLRKLEPGIPWLCVVDRDYLTDQEVARIEESGNTFVWGARMLENLLLDTELLGLAFKSSPYFTADALEKDLRSSVNSTKEASITQFVSARVNGTEYHAGESTFSQNSDKILGSLEFELARIQHQIKQYETVRDSVVEEIAERWDRDWKLFAEGKRVLKSLNEKYKVYKNAQSLIDKLMVEAREDSALMPAEIRRLKEEIDATKASVSAAQIGHAHPLVNHKSVDSIIRTSNPEPNLNRAMDADPYM